MKNLKFTKAIAFASVIAIAVGCNKEENPVPAKTPVCKLVTLKDSAGVTHEAYEYNADNKLSKLTYYYRGEAGQSYAYTYYKDSVVEKNVDSEGDVDIRVYHLGQNGKATKSTRIDTSDSKVYYDTTLYTYNGEGYLIKMVRKYGYKELGSSTYTPNSTPVTYEYTIVNGNTTQIKKYEGTFLSFEQNHEFYLDKVNSLFGGFFNEYYEYVDFLGKPDKNLLNKSVMDSQYGVYSVERQYTLKADNQIESAVFSSTDDGVPYKKFNYSLVYNCK